MRLTSIRIITDDLDRMVAFDEKTTGITAQRPPPPFAELVSPSAMLAIGHSQAVALFGRHRRRGADTDLRA